MLNPLEIVITRLTLQNDECQGCKGWVGVVSQSVIKAAVQPMGPLRVLSMLIHKTDSPEECPAMAGAQ